MNIEFEQYENPYKRRLRIVDFATEYAVNIIENTTLSKEVNSVIEKQVDDTFFANKAIEDLNAHRNQITDQNMQTVETDNGVIGLEDYRQKVKSAYDNSKDFPINDMDIFNKAA